jgi:DNA-directed RNA polymerase subunit RPC12/RpoP
MIKFILQSNDYQGGSPGYGWLLSDIYIGYDKSKDHVPPILSIKSPQNGAELSSTIRIEANLTDNENNLDLSTLQLRIDGSTKSISNYTYNSETGLLTINLDTLSLTNGWHTLTILVKDKDGNQAEVSISVNVNNWLSIIGKVITWGISGIALLSITGYLVYKGVEHLIEVRKLHIADKTRGYRKKAKLKVKNGEDLEQLQSKYPLTLYCKYCDSWFYSDSKFDIICPLCGHDQIYAAYNCLNCGKWNLKDTPSQDYHCSRCEVQLYKQDKEKIQDLLIREKEKALIEFKKEKKEFSILD